MPAVTIEDGRVSLGDQELPGVMESLEIKGELRLSRLRAANRSGSAKLPRGWEDGDVVLRLTLTTDEEGTCYDKVKSLEAVFKKAKKAKPVVWRVVNTHINARQITEVLFHRLSTAESSADDTIMAELSLLEWRPKVVKRERRQSAVAKADAEGQLDAEGFIEGTTALGVNLTTEDQATILKGFQTAARERLADSSGRTSTAPASASFSDGDTPPAPGGG